MAIYGTSVYEDNTSLFAETYECISKLDSLLFIYRENSSEVIQEALKDIKNNMAEKAKYYAETIVIKLQELFRRIKKIIDNIIFNIKKALSKRICRRVKIDANNFAAMIRKDPNFKIKLLDDEYPPERFTIYIDTYTEYGDQFWDIFSDHLNYVNDPKSKIEQESIWVSSAYNNLNNDVDETFNDCCYVHYGFREDHKDIIEKGMNNISDTVNNILLKLEYYRKINDGFLKVILNKPMHMNRATMNNGSNSLTNNDNSEFKELDRYLLYSKVLTDRMHIYEILVPLLMALYVKNYNLLNKLHLIKWT